jgi:hypothetical protein
MINSSLVPAKYIKTKGHNYAGSYGPTVSCCLCPAACPRRIGAGNACSIKSNLLSFILTNIFLNFNVRSGEKAIYFQQGHEVV